MTTTPLPAPALSLDGRAFINGERVAARDGQTFDCYSPVDGRLLTTVARGQAADIDAAVAAARAAFEDRRWAGMPPARRKRVMMAFAVQLLQHARPQQRFGHLGGRDDRRGQRAHHRDRR